MKIFTIVSFSIFLFGNASGAGLEVTELKRDKPVDFQSEILPILRSNCLACHNRTRSKGDVILETPADIRKGNDDGSYVEPGNAKDSFLFTIAGHIDDPVMPPAKNKVGAKNLKPGELGLLKLWIEQGAKGEMRAAAPVVWQSYRRETPPIYAVAAGPHGRFAAAGRGNQIHLYDATVGKMLANLTDPSLAKHGFYGANDAAHLDVVNALAFHPNGRLLASGGFRVVKLWQRSAPAKKKEFAVKALDGVRAVSSDGKWLAVAEENNQTGLWNLSQGKRVRGLEKLQSPVKGLAFSANSSRLVSGAADGSVRVWNVADGKLVAETVHEQGAGSVAILGEEGKWFASAHADKVIRVWELPAEPGGEVKMLKELKGHTGEVTTLLRMPTDPKQLISGGKDNTARIWNAEGGTAIRSISINTLMLSLAVSSDGQRIATSHGTNIVRLWNATDGKKVADLKGNAKLFRETGREDGELAFSKAELKYFTDELKKRGDEKKQVIDRKTKSEKDLKTAQEKPIAEKKAASVKARTERDAADKKVEDTTKKAEETQKAFEAKETASKDAEAKSKEVAVKVVAPEGLEKTANQTLESKKNDLAAKKKTRESLINTKLNPAKQKLVKATQFFIEVEKKRVEMETAFKSAGNEVEKAKQARVNAEKAAETAEVLGKKVQDDPAKPELEKQKAKQEAATKRKLAADAKTAHENLINSKLNPAKQKLDASVKAVVDGKSKKEAAGKELAAAEGEAKKADLAIVVSDTVYKDAEKKANEAKMEADKVRKVRDDATKLLVDAKKVFGEAQKLRDDSKKAKTDAEADAKKKEAALTKAEKEYLDIENPRAQFEREFKRAGQDLVKAEAKEKEYQAYMVSAENDEKREVDENKVAKDVLAAAVKTVLRTVCFSSDGSLVFAAGDGKYTQAWSAGDGQTLESIELGEDGVDFLASTGEGSLFVAKGDTSALWDVFGKWELSKVLGGDDAASPIVNRVTSLNFSPDGKQLASGGGDPSRTGEILVWNVENGKLIHNLPGVHSDTVHAIEFSRDGKRLASGAADKFARVTEIKSGALVHSFEGHTHHVMGVSLQANGRVLASVGADKEIKVWNVVNGDRAGKGGGYTKEITSIRFVGYGDNALITTADKKAKLIRVPLGNPANVRDFAGVGDVMHAGDVSRNGKVAVAGGEDGVFRVWNIADGKALQTFEPPAKEDPDGLTAN